MVGEIYKSKYMTVKHTFLVIPGANPVQIGCMGHSGLVQSKSWYW